MLGFLIITAIFIFIIAGSSQILSVKEVQDNWEKYRCRPDIIMSASIYGYSTSENFNFCIGSAFEQRAKAIVGPFFVYLKEFVEILMTMLESINSVRMTFSTIMGNVAIVFQEFSSRIQALFYRIQMTAIRIKFLMGRVFATLYAVMFMGLAGIKATQNFGNTFLFKFLDTFCFHPNTLVHIQSKGMIPIKDVKIGDTFTTGDKVTATFEFKADGQEMVSLNNIIVSTNHYLLHNGKWIKAVDHPDAKLIAAWSGGAEKPLICINTNTHSFHIGPYIFRDYDETDSGDIESMEMALTMLNGKPSSGPAGPAAAGASSPAGPAGVAACHGKTLLKVKNQAPVQASSIQLGTMLTMGEVIGIVKKECTSISKYGNDIFASGTAVWCMTTKSWRRVSDITGTEELEQPEVFYSFIVTPSASIVTSSDTVFRDYMEVHTPDLELPYAASLNSLSI
jgi:hypothetical protein